MKNFIEVYICLTVMMVISIGGAPDLDKLIVWCAAIICLAIRRGRS